MVACCCWKSALVLDKTTTKVTKYEGRCSTEDALVKVSKRGMKGYIIYDRAKEYEAPPSEWRPRAEWGMIVL